VNPARQQRPAAPGAERRGTRQRLDLALVARGLVPSREKAQALVMAGEVLVDGAPATKPGAPVRDDAAIALARQPTHVGRGALKLEGALDALGVDPEGRVAIDVGASTGGFTQVLLERGARRVYAVDVGRAQLHERLRRDPRVVVLERTNARTLSPREIPEPCSLAVMDVSFISVRKILPALRAVLATPAEALVLVKPQFELRRQDVGRGGLVRDPELHARAVRDVAEAAIAQGYALRGACASPVAGGEGNREFFLHLGVPGPGIGPEAALALAREVTRP
jgi:23S rRNA (cytidine1920-2'-O)/16S rRNA (cytidine1409-2'-O)-methyltransferase